MYLVTNNTTQHVLARFIRDHGHPCRILADGSLRCAFQWSGDGALGFSWAIATVPGNLSSVRNWLGY